ncbi:MAG: lipocalin family protein [Chloroflexota bacterium]|nr:hypothetical protein [Chloroflexota bacterium]
MMSPNSRTRRSLATMAGAALFGAGCNVPGGGVSAPVPTIAVPRAPDPPARALPPVRFPQDEGPHDVLAEWWYYTGHLYAPAKDFPKAFGAEPQALRLPDEGGDDGPYADEREFGFEFVIFRGVRGDRPPGYASHFALTDVDGGGFAYDQRVEIALSETALPSTTKVALADTDPRPPAAAIPVANMPALSFAPTDRPGGIVSRGPEGGGFDLSLGGWRMRGVDGRDRLWAAGPGYRIDLELSGQRPAALHDGDPPGKAGLIDFGPAGYSYYYSRTRMGIKGELGFGSATSKIRGTGWMDHQWGDFLVLGGGGWDWFSAHLADGRDLTISIVRDDTGKVVLSYGTLVLDDGTAVHVGPGAFSVNGTQTWKSGRTGYTYPTSWRVAVPSHGIDHEWTALVRDQELVTTASTGVTYWEGTVRLRDSSTGRYAGRGYVELTGYAK